MLAPGGLPDDDQKVERRQWRSRILTHSTRGSGDDSASSGPADGALRWF
jgi:hypothetical protein